jgi:hypothetical protein
MSKWTLLTLPRWKLGSPQTKEKIEALIDEGCAAAERGEVIDGDDARSRLNEMRRAKFPRYFMPPR